MIDGYATPKPGQVWERRGVQLLIQDKADAKNMRARLDRGERWTLYGKVKRVKT